VATFKPEPGRGRSFKEPGSQKDRTQAVIAAPFLEPVVNFYALFAAICLRPLTLSAVISSMYGTKGLSN